MECHAALLHGNTLQLLYLVLSFNIEYGSKFNLFSEFG